MTNVSSISKIENFKNPSAIFSSSKIQKEKSSFEKLLSNLQQNQTSNKKVQNQENSKNSSSVVTKKTIDKESELYKKSLELETFFVKNMLSQMRKTVLKSTEQSFSQNMYEDMLFDEYAKITSENANFGLAEKIYLQLAEKS